jgi:malate synthase
MEDAATAEISRTQVWQWLKRSQIRMEEHLLHIYIKLLAEEVAKKIQIDEKIKSKLKLAYRF